MRPGKVFLFLSHVVLVASLFGQGKVYLVLGSDTAIWEGMDVGRYHCTYRLDLYQSPTRNAVRVMDPAFREQLRDSEGRPMPLTWWMMAGNIFRYATNVNIPLPNIMTLHLMKKHHGEAIKRWGDELSLHYHTFIWSDYDGDGKYHWNQALNFEECRDDFDVTMAQFLLEEDVSPVSFRSGWHYMDNEWQRYLDELLPFSMHNDWPAKRTDTSEPLDNTYDWSRAPSTWEPYRPSPDDYQIPGNGRGWNVRSKHIGSIRAADMDTMFARAQRGIDQVACLWGHLPEVDFLDNLRRVHSLAHSSAARYTNVSFHYTTAVEAMQRWLGAEGRTAPSLSIHEVPAGESVSFLIQSNVPIFQKQPFVAVKDISERYSLVPCELTGQNTWKTTTPTVRATLAKVGVAVTDTVGYLATRILRYVPDDLFVDDGEEGYSELRGAWATAATSGWNGSSRVTALQANDSAKVHWRIEVPETKRYIISTQVPPLSNPAGRILYRLAINGQTVDTVNYAEPLPPARWIPLGAWELAAGSEVYLEMVVRAEGQIGKVVAADVVKVSPLVRERYLELGASVLNYGEVSRGDSVSLPLRLKNQGAGMLTISSSRSVNGLATVAVEFPIHLGPFRDTTLTVFFFSECTGPANDTLYFMSDDPLRPEAAVLVSAVVQNYFQIVDNDDEGYYHEVGTWQTSVAQAYGPSSRFTNLSGPPGASATFWTIMKHTGIYDIQFILPTTVNSANRALYVIEVSDVPVDSLLIDQNVGSGGWVALRRLPLVAGARVAVKVVNTGLSASGAVMRADAIKLAFVAPVTFADSEPAAVVPERFELQQNYPNPFNASTVVQFALPVRSRVRLSVLNLMGQVVDEVASGELESGFHMRRWEASVPSGMYVLRLQATGVADPVQRFEAVRKMVVVR